MMSRTPPGEQTSGAFTLLEIDSNSRARATAREQLVEH
jgi:hypothetical protein